MTVPGKSAASAAIDDRKLEEMAAGPLRPLLPILNDAKAMVPLVVVMAFLPTLYAAAHSTLTEQGALQGLAGLNVLSAVDTTSTSNPAGLDRFEQLRFQPPFMSWLTALCLNTFGMGRTAGLSMSAVLCTAGLLLAAYTLGRRLGGEQLGLVTVLLLAFNPLILAGAQQPIPQSAAGLFALLTLTGVISHWQRSSSMTSYQLLLGGIALALCLLAGGPLAIAIAVVVVIYVAIWKIEARWRRSTGVIWDRSELSRRTAFRSAALLGATAFALAGWHVLLLSSHFGMEFWARWFMPTETDSSGLGPDGGRSLVLSTWSALNRLALPVFGLALLGLGVVIRDVWRGEEDPARRHRLILFPWIAVALLACRYSGALTRPDDAAANIWVTMLVIPLIIAAALALIEIAERRVGFATTLAAGLLTLADTAIFAPFYSSDALPDVTPQTGRLSVVFEKTSVTVTATIIAALALFRFAQSSELRRRSVMLILLAALVLSNCLYGASSVGRTPASDREIDDLRSGLSRLMRVERLTFVAPFRSGKPLPAEQLPARLVYGLACLWPDAEINVADSWEEAVSHGRLSDGAETAGSTVLVSWSPRGVARGSSPDPSLKPAAPSFLFQGLEVVVYVRDAGLATNTDQHSESSVSLHSR